MWKVITGTWSSSYSEIEVEALWEINDFRIRAEFRDVAIQLPERMMKNDCEAFRKKLDMDIRITLGWDTDNTDIDLHIVEPNGEEAYYGHKNTVNGGTILIYIY